MRDLGHKSSLHHQNYKRGLWAETLALCYFLMRGYRPVSRRYKCKSGEIDLVVKKGSRLIFAEVKYRRNSDHALESVSPKNQQRVRRAAEHFLQRYKHSYPQSGDSLQLRFDVVAISPYFNIKHIRNAF